MRIDITVLLALVVAGLSFLSPPPARAQSFQDLSPGSLQLLQNTLHSGDMLMQDAELAMIRRAYATARRAYEEALNAYLGEGNLRGQAAALEALGGLHLRADETMQARQRFEQAYTYRKRLKDEEGQRAALEQLAPLYLKVDDTARATETWRALRKIYQEAGEKDRVAGTWLATGIAAHREARYEDALKDMLKAYDLYNALGLTREVADVFHAQARVVQDMGRFDLAYDLDMRADAATPGDTVIRLALVFDALALGRYEEVLSRIMVLQDRSLSPLQQIQLRLAELTARAASPWIEGIPPAADALAKAFDQLAPNEQRVPNLEPVRQFLRTHDEMPRVYRDALQGVVQVLSIRKGPLSKTTLSSQLEVMVASARGGVSS